MKKTLFSLALYLSLLSPYSINSQCCRGYLNLGGSIVLSGVYIKIGLVCSGNPNGWCSGSIHNYCTGLTINGANCSSVTFTTNYETNC